MIVRIYRSSKTARYDFRYRAPAILLAVFCTTLLFASPPPAPNASPSETATASSRDVNNFHINIRRLKQGISRQEAQIEENKVAEQGILVELEEVDKRLGEQQRKLSELQNKMESQQELIDRKESTLKKLKKEKDIVENHLKNRISAYYTMGNIGLLNITFSTRTLPELLTFHDAFDSLIKYDQNVIKVYRETISELERAKKALDLEKGVLQEFILQNQHQLEILEQTKQDKKFLLTNVRIQTQLHKQAADEMREASQELTDSLVNMKSQQAPQMLSFASCKGNLPPPVDGEITTLYHQKKTNKLGVARVSDGIELRAPAGTPVVAVSDGEVIFSGYLRGYGNTVIIHHGFQYYTVTSRIENILVKKGQNVRKETPIGAVGIAATLFDEGLYFEIRHGKESLDPLEWLNPNRLSAPHESSAERSEMETSTQE